MEGNEGYISNMGLRIEKDSGLIEALTPLEQQRYLDSSDFKEESIEEKYLKDIWERYENLGKLDLSLKRRREEKGKRGGDEDSVPVMMYKGTIITGDREYRERFNTDEDFRNGEVILLKKSVDLLKNKE